MVYPLHSRIAERAKRLLNMKEFSTAGSPEEVIPMNLICPYERQYILRMLVQAEGGNFCLPPDLDWLMPAFRAALWYQSFRVRSNHPFCYITVRHGIVESKTDDEWHLDGFSTRVSYVPEQNYIWSSTHPTEYANVNVDIPKDFDPLSHNVNKYLQEFVDPGWVRQCKPKTMYCLDPYMLHRRPKSAQGTTRTFFRISFLPIEINDINNTPNPRLPRLCDRDGVSFRDKLKTYGRE